MCLLLPTRTTRQCTASALHSAALSVALSWVFFLLPPPPLFLPLLPPPPQQLSPPDGGWVTPHTIHSIQMMSLYTSRYTLHSIQSLYDIGDAPEAAAAASSCCSLRIFFSILSDSFVPGGVDASSSILFISASDDVPVPGRIWVTRRNKLANAWYM